MKKNFKDFLYNTNDIILAIVIITIAGLLIYWRMNVIMDYPQTLEAQTAQEEVQHENDGKEEATPKEDSAKNEETAKDNEEPSSDATYTDGKLTKDVRVRIAGGSATAAAQCLIDANLFKDYDDYASTCKAADCTPEAIKAGTFTFAKGSTPKGIVKKVTN